MKQSRIYLLVIIFSLFFAACREERKLDIASTINPKKMASMSSRNVATLLSDSGHIKYKMVTPLLKVFNEGDNPHWEFPEGVFLEQYDPLYKVIATIAADSATYYTDKKLWRLIGNVEITRFPKDLFLSPRLFYDERAERAYSDTFMHIENATHVIEGQGFESNSNFTHYRILKPEGIFPINNN